MLDWNSFDMITFLKPYKKYHNIYRIVKRVNVSNEYIFLRLLRRELAVLADGLSCSVRSTCPIQTEPCVVAIKMPAVILHGSLKTTWLLFF